MTFWLITALAIAAAYGWVVRQRVVRERHGVDDPDMLDEAEREVQDLDVHATPEDARDLPDWGPGAPRS